MAGTNMIALRGLRVIHSCCNSHKPYLVPNLHHLSFYFSTSLFSSSLFNGRNKTFEPKVPHVTRSDFLNLLSRPRLYNAIVKSRVDIDPLVKLESRTIDTQDNLESFLSSELPSHPNLIHGQLENRLRYRILQRNIYPNRFEAHLKVNVGSIDEEDDEQGIAHMTQHLLDSDKYSELMEIGSTVAAYTLRDRTVYYIASQTKLKHFEDALLLGEDLVSYSLDALNEQAFEPNLRASCLARERQAVLSQLQLNNTIDDRIENQLCQHLHSENKFSKRSNVGGLEDQIKKWNIDQIRKFHKRWYFPANATLYIVGDINDVSKTIDAIQAAFGKSKGSSEILQNERPPTYHNWSLPPSSTNDQKPPQIFKHELIRNFSFDIYSKKFLQSPNNKFRTYDDLRNFVMKQIYLSVLSFRIYAKYKSSESSSTLREVQHRDFAEYGCALTSLSAESGPRDWKTAIKGAFHEVRRLKERGINYGEFTFHKDEVLKTTARAMAVLDDSSNCDVVDFIMVNDELGQTIMEEWEADQSLAAIDSTITLEETNSIGRKLLEFISDYGKPSAPVPTTIMVCAPSSHEVNGELVEFTITPSEIESTMKQGLEEPIYDIEPEIEIPTELISSARLQELLLEHQPTFIPLINSKANMKKFHDNGTNITLRRLSNGISVNYKISENELDEGVIEVRISGGRAVESSDLKGAILVGVETLCVGGCSVGHFSSEQVHLFCLKNNIDYSFTPTEEFVNIKLRFSSRDNGMQAAFQFLHMLLEQSVWSEDAFDIAKQFNISKFQSTSKSLEQSTTRKLMLAMLDGDERFVDPTPISLQNLTLQSVKDAVLNQLNGSNMEVSIVGDFSEEDIESNIINYLGTVINTRNHKDELQPYDPIMYSASPSQLQSHVFVKDTEERTCARIAGLTPNYRGITIDGKHWLESKLNIEGEHLQSKHGDHPLFFAITMEFLADMINESLNREIVGRTGLAFEANLDLRLFHKLNLGWYMISIVSTPCNVHEAVDVCKEALKDFGSKEISQYYLDQVRGCLLMRHEDKIKSNAYWRNLLCHLHPDSASRKDIPCIKDVASLYKLVRVEDIRTAYNQLRVDDDCIHSCIGIAGQRDARKYA